MEFYRYLAKHSKTLRYVFGLIKNKNKKNSQTHEYQTHQILFVVNQVLSQIQTIKENDHGKIKSNFLKTPNISHEVIQKLTEKKLNDISHLIFHYSHMNMRYYLEHMRN